MRQMEQGNGRLVAVVEDNERNARLVRDVLVAHGFEVTVFSNGADAVRELPGMCPDVLLLDVQLPDIGGVEVLQGLRAAGLNDAPAVAVTAYAMSGDREALIDAGFDDYVAKPIDVASLADRVARIIETGRN